MHILPTTPPKPPSHGPNLRPLPHPPRVRKRPRSAPTVCVSSWKRLEPRNGHQVDEPSVKSSGRDGERAFLVIRTTPGPFLWQILSHLSEFKRLLVGFKRILRLFSPVFLHPLAPLELAGARHPILPLSASQLQIRVTCFAQLDQTASPPKNNDSEDL